MFFSTLDFTSSMDLINKEKTLQSICSLNIDAAKIAMQLKNLVGNFITDKDILFFLTSDSTYNNILQEFAGIADIKKRIVPPASSGSDWTNERELAYYCIVIQDINDIGEICEIKDFSKEAFCFIDKNKNFNPSVILSSKITRELMQQFNNDFQRSVVFVISNPAQESCVDCMMESYLRNILPESDFFIQVRYTMRLRVNNVNKNATPDVAIILFPDIYVGVIVVEDKSKYRGITANQQDNAEAQMIAEGIAVAQQTNWPTNMPVFMLRVISTKISVYKATFTRDFLQSVETGKRRTKPTVVLRSAPLDLLKGIPGYDLAKSSDRSDVTQIICSIAMFISTQIHKCIPGSS